LTLQAADARVFSTSFRASVNSMTSQLAIAEMQSKKSFELGLWSADAEDAELMRLAANADTSKAEDAVRKMKVRELLVSQAQSRREEIRSLRRDLEKSMEMNEGHDALRLSKVREGIVCKVLGLLTHHVGENQAPESTWAASVGSIQ
jgi:hypothetical protein